MGIWCYVTQRFARVPIRFVLANNFDCVMHVVDEIAGLPHEGYFLEDNKSG